MLASQPCSQHSPRASCSRSLTSPPPGGLLGFPQYLYCYFTTCCPRHMNQGPKNIPVLLLTSGVSLPLSFSLSRVGTDVLWSVFLSELKTLGRIEWNRTRAGPSPLGVSSKQLREAPTQAWCGGPSPTANQNQNRAPQEPTQAPAGHQQADNACPGPEFTPGPAGGRTGLHLRLTDGLERSSLPPRDSCC